MTEDDDDEALDEASPRRCLFRLRSWWIKKRSFYVEQKPSRDDERNEPNVTMDVTSDDAASAEGAEEADASSFSASSFSVSTMPSAASRRRSVSASIGSNVEVEPSTFLDAQPIAFARHRTHDSFQGSLESIDSLVESYWDPDDEGSHSTPVVTNLARGSAFFEAHVDFLVGQTQPRGVELVWDNISLNPPDDTADL